MVPVGSVALEIELEVTVRLKIFIRSHLGFHSILRSYAAVRLLSQSLAASMREICLSSDCGGAGLVAADIQIHSYSCRSRWVLMTPRFGDGDGDGDGDGW